MWIHRTSTVVLLPSAAALHRASHFFIQLLEVSPSSVRLASSPGPSKWPHSFLAGCGHNLVQKMPVTYNKVVKNKLLMKKVTDHAFERHMETEKKIAKLRRIIDILRKQPNASMLYIYMLRRGKAVGLLKPEKMTDILAKYPGVIHLYYESETDLHWVRLPKYVLELLDEEKKITEELAPRAVPRLRKLLMMSSTRTIQLDCLNFLKPDLGLPDDFQESILKNYPEHFKIVDVGKNTVPLVELVSCDESLTIPVIDEERKKEALKLGLSSEETKARAFSFPVSYPPSFKIKQSFRSKMRHWQQLPYISPYQVASRLNMESPEACKRAVAVLHEYLHLTVEKKSKVERVARLREALKLPKKIGHTVLEHPGVFYFSSKGQGQTIFLRSAYHKGELIEKDPLHVLRDKFIELMSKGRNKSLQKGVDAIKSERIKYKEGRSRRQNYGMTPNEDDEDELLEDSDNRASIDEESCNFESGLEDESYDSHEYVKSDDRALL